MMSHAFHTSYLRGRDREDHGLRAALQKVSKTSSQQTNQEWWCTPVNPSYVRDIGRRIMDPTQGQPLAKT
jgi:hypothetical protein